MIRMFLILVAMTLVVVLGTMYIEDKEWGNLGLLCVKSGLFALALYLVW